MDAGVLLDSGLAGDGDIHFQADRPVAIGGPIDLDGEIVLDYGMVEIDHAQTIASPIRFSGGSLMANRDVTLTNLPVSGPALSISAPDATVTAPTWILAADTSRPILPASTHCAWTIDETIFANVGRGFSGEIEVVGEGLLFVWHPTAWACPSRHTRVEPPERRPSARARAQHPRGHLPGKCRGFLARRGSTDPGSHRWWQCNHARRQRVAGRRRVVTGHRRRLSATLRIEGASAAGR